MTKVLLGRQRSTKALAWCFWGCWAITLMCSIHAPANASSQTTPPKPDEPVALNSDIVIRSPEKELLEKEALAGSASAAFKLGKSLSITQGATDETIYWLQIAIENGSRQSIYTLAALLTLREEPRNKARGRYWLEEIMRNGPVEDREAARQLLEELDRKKK